MSFTNSYIKARTLKYRHEGSMNFRESVKNSTDYEEVLYLATFPPKVGDDGFFWKLDIKKTIDYSSLGSDDFNDEVDDFDEDDYVTLSLSCPKMDHSFQNVVVWCDLYLMGEQKFGGILQNITTGNGDQCKQVKHPCLSIPVTGEVSFRCEITVHELTKEFHAKIPSNFGIPSSSEAAAKESTIGLDLEQLLTNPKHSDVIMKCDGQEFHAHKCILSARSKVFAAMFEHDTKENQKNCVEIDNVEREAMKGFIYFIYTDNPPETLATLAQQLFALGDQYALEKLKNLAEEELIKGISLVNVVEMLEFAYLHSSPKLQDVTMEFVIENFDEIVDLEEWDEMMKKYPKLMKEIMRMSLQKFKL